MHKLGRPRALPLIKRRALSQSCCPTGQGRCKRSLTLPQRIRRHRASWSPAKDRSLSWSHVKDRSLFCLRSAYYCL